MRKWMIIAVLGISVVAVAQEPKSPATLKSILLQELRETHNEKNWFVSEKEAAGGLTGEQAAATDGKVHSVGQLVQHLNFWNAQSLAKFKNEKTSNVSDNNETFKFDAKQWDATQKRFDEIMTELEQIVQSADDATLAKIAPRMARVAQHNAYHIAEMVTIRKQQGTWNPENGVK
ncbi:MAG TPA: DinB family protein [Terriglobales bacterium]|nr:DinB family protein [Terriglobales bacterium]